MSGAVKVLNVKLQRADHNVSWGFNIQGGVEFNAPLSIAKVHFGSLAEKAQVQQDDFVLRIGGMSTERMTHAQARDAILSQCDYLEMTLQRGAPPRSDDYTSRYEFPKHQLMNPDHMGRVPVASPQVGVQLGGNRALLTQSYNSPMGLYSSKNVADTLVSTLHNANYPPPPPSSSSFSYMQPAMYVQQPPPAQYHPPPPSAYAPQPPPPPPRHQFAPPPPPRPVYSAAPPPGQQQQRRQINRGNRGSALFNQAGSSGTSLPTCTSCHQVIRGPFISAVGKIWCPGHFVCAHPNCGMNLHEVGFVEEGGKLYCERDFEAYFAPPCHKCHNKIIGECCYALDKTYHPECFTCGHCKQKIGNGSFHIEDGVIYCSKDFAEMFSVKCAGCEFPIEPLDKFFEAIGQKWHTECFICSQCNVPLNGTYVTKGNKPYCKRHAY